MKALFAPLRELGEFEEIRSRMRNVSGLLHVRGCIETQKEHMIAALGEDYPTRVIIAANELRAREIYENYQMLDENALLLPARDFIFFQADVHSNLLEQQRIGVWKALATGKKLTVITTIAAFMSRQMPFEHWKKAVCTLKTGDVVDVNFWKRRLVELGYERTAQVEAPGQFAIRGGILDIYGLAEENPVRVELWGDEIDSLRLFDAESQRSLENLEEITIFPATELILEPEERAQGLKLLKKDFKRCHDQLLRDRRTEEAHRLAMLLKETADRLEEFEDPNGMDAFLPYFYPGSGGLLDVFPGGTVFFIDEPGRTQEAGEAVETEFRESMKMRLDKGYIAAAQADVMISCRRVVSLLSDRCCIGLSTLENPRSEWNVQGRYFVDVRSVSPYNNSVETLVKDLEKWRKGKYRILIISSSRTRAQRLAGELMEQGLTAFYSVDPERCLANGEIMTTYGSARRGYEYPLIRFVVISDSDIFGKEKRQTRRRQRRFEGGRKIGSFSELSIGDYVVHESHGLGIYRGIEKIESDHILKDYMRIEYAEGGVLFVLASSLDAIQKYADSDAKAPKLNRLGGQEWNKTKTRVRTAVREIARELVQLYAARQRRDGFVYSPDTVWQREFEEMFPFEETEDQLLAIRDTKQDMESTKIMDRLICGDVGYGKTEIAIRAAFKAVQDGKQVAYLVPTTILAQQHYNTFVERLKEFPVRIDLLCRFRTTAEQKKTIQDLGSGLVDIVIGTHRILSKDVRFRNLGLLVIDEEQRFGVTHKEKIKQMKQDVDVLTLTATPIPRTLHMSLVGIRDMSVLEEAPQDRLPIQTFVMEYNEELMREAIARELARNGQVYYVYNRVNTIMDMTDRIAALVPQARVAFAHGQMKERELEQIMVEFINGEIDVLVTTTIIETGLDIANANTMIIHDADTMGLSQLYQLRGRIGRSARTSYAFLMYRRNKVLREVAEKRLSAIREFTELGSGFRIAMRDLEIRGAGNLLGAEQHGHMEAIGYDLYCKLLGEAVQEVRQQAPPAETFETAIDLDVDAYIPDRYISNESQKLDVYKRIADIQTEEDYDDMIEELIDRFGEIPKSVQNLLMIARLKAKAHQADLTDLVQKGDEIRFVFYEKARVDVSRLETFLAGYHQRMTFRMEKRMLIYAHPRKNAADQKDIFQVISGILENIESSLLQKEPAVV